ncbi:MAG: hypothetical protein KAT93_07900 [Desulfuromonadales bacterium]|nr:hypothetical protein [Desulfuromonadales bacterium]
MAEKSHATGRIRAADLLNSERLQKVFWLLLSGWFSSRDIGRTCDRYSVSTLRAELEADINGLTINKKHKDGHFHYRIELNARAKYLRRKLQEQAEAARLAG